MKTMLTFCVGLLALGSLVSGPLSAGDEATDQKLLKAQEVVRQFEEGQDRVRVIVNLVQSEAMAESLGPHNQPAANKLRDRIRTLQETVLSPLAGTEFELRHQFENQAGFSGYVTPAGFAQLLSDPRVASIDPARQLAKFTKQGIPLMNASACGQEYRGQGVAIAIIDDGIDYTHPKLGGESFPNSKVIGGRDIGEMDSDPFPIRSSLSTEWHGTWCAGIAAGDLGTDGDYIGGVAPAAKLYSLKVSEVDWLSQEVVIWDDTAIDAIDWCVTHKNDDPSHPILVISIALGHSRHSSPCDGGAFDSYTQAIRNATTAGITVVAASGNDGYCNAMAKPACLSGVVSVGAVYDANIGRHPGSGFVGLISPDSCAGYECVEGWEGGEQVYKCYVDYTTAADQVPTNSNSAPFLDLLAPGTAAYATDIAGAEGNSFGDYTEFGGTSAACAYAAGAVACLQSATKEKTGDFLSPENVRQILKDTGKLVVDSKSGVKTPRIDLGRAIGSNPPELHLVCDAPGDQSHTVCWSLFTEYSATDTPTDIPDAGTVVSELTIGYAGAIEDLNVKLDVTHGWTRDLDVFLVAPDGTRVELFTDVGDIGDDFDGTVVLDDEAGISITDGSAPFSGSYRPEGSLADFAGKDITGTWKLEVTDNGTIIVGTLNCWSLMVNMAGASDGGSAGDRRQYSATDTPADIPDPGTVVSELTIDDAGIIEDLDVTLDITHWWVEDLDVFLVAPDGTRVELFTDVGGGGDDFDGTVLNDEAGISIRDGSAPFSGSYRPEGSLADFAGKDITGTWKLEVTDDGFLATGTLNAWSLTARLAGVASDVTPNFACYVECATDEQFTNIVASSGWVFDGCYTFEGLNPTQLYWYRGKAMPLAMWQQTTRTDFEADTLVDVQATTSGDVVLAGTGGTGTELMVIQNPGYEASGAWTVYESDPDGIASFQSPNWASEGSYSFSTAFWLWKWHAVGDYGAFRQTVDFTDIGTLVFDYCTWWADDVKVSILIDGSEVWSAQPPDVSEDIHYDVPIDVSALTGLLSLELRAEAMQAGDFGNSVFFDNLRAYGVGNLASSGRIISGPIVLEEGDTWSLVRFDSTVPAGASLTVDVLPETGSVPIAGYADVATGTDLSGVTETTIRLRANLSRAPQGQSPVLHSWSVGSWDTSRESDWSDPISSECPEREFRLLATTYGPSNLVELQTDPVAEILIGPVDLFIPGLDFAPNGDLYGISSSLYRIDPATGSTTQIATINSATESFILMRSISFAPDGTLYAVSLLDDRLYTINTATAFATEVGLITGGLVWGIEFSDDGTLYGAFADLFTIDPTTARVISKVADLPAYITELDWAPDGYIYGVDDYDLYRIVPLSQSTTLIGTYESEIEGVASHAPGGSLMMPQAGDRGVSSIGGGSRTILDEDRIRKLDALEKQVFEAAKQRAIDSLERQD